MLCCVDMRRMMVSIVCCIPLCIGETQKKGQPSWTDRWIELLKREFQLSLSPVPCPSLGAPPCPASILSFLLWLNLYMYSHSELGQSGNIYDWVDTITDWDEGGSWVVNHLSEKSPLVVSVVCGQITMIYILANLTALSRSLYQWLEVSLSRHLTKSPRHYGFRVIWFCRMLTAK